MRLIALLIAVLGIFSCSSPRYIYAPAPANNPYFTKKGESKIAAYYSGGSIRGSDLNFNKPFNRGFDLHGAYAISDHWGLTASYYNRKEKDNFNSSFINYFDSSLVSYHRRLIEFGAGYFTPIGNSDHYYFNVYGGFALGKFDILDRGTDKQGIAYSRFHQSNITKYFIQPSLSTIIGEHFRLSFIPRISMVHYGNIQTSYTQEEQQYFWLDKIDKRLITFFEPSVNMQIGIPGADWVKLDGSFTYCSDPFSAVYKIEARSVNASIGLAFDFTKIRKK